MRIQLFFALSACIRKVDICSIFAFFHPTSRTPINFNTHKEKPGYIQLFHIINKIWLAHPGVSKQTYPQMNQTLTDMFCTFMKF